MAPSSASSSSCLTVRDRQDQIWLDLALGATMPLGASAASHADILQTVAPEWTAELASLRDDSDSLDELLSGHKAFSGFTFARFVASTDEANELALWLARSSGARDGYRVITLLGSQHGGSLALRSASGRPDWQSMDGPVCAGFRHVKPASTTAIEKAIDESVVAVMISPIDWSRGGVPFDLAYLQEVQAICRKQSVAFILDESKVAPGVSGDLGFWAHAGLQPDLLTLGTGWFYGMPGGVVLSRLDHADLVDRSGVNSTDRGASTLNQVLTAMGCFSEPSPVHRVAFRQTMAALERVSTAKTHQDSLSRWTARLEELKTGFDFVREIAQQGWWTTLALDIPAAELVATAAKQKLYLRATGDSTVLACPPVVCQPDEIDQTVKLLRLTLEMIETASTAETLS